VTYASCASFLSGQAAERTRQNMIQRETVPALGASAFQIIHRLLVAANNILRTATPFALAAHVGQRNEHSSAGHATPPPS
jgi:hypothetical protein